MTLRRDAVAVKLFLTCWIVFALHFATNVVREHYPAFALAERGTLRVDPYVGLHPDFVEVEGRGVFINNNPGASMLAAIPYALVRPLVDAIVTRSDRARAQRGTPLTTDYADPRPNRIAFFRRVRERGLDIRFGLASFAIQVLFTAPLSAASAVVIRTLLLRSGFGATASLWLALLYAFGTPVFFRSGHLNHNLLVSHASLFSFALLYRPGGVEARPSRLLGAGALAGAGVLCDYSGVVPLAALGVYALAKLVRRFGPRAALLRTAWMVVGAALPIAVLIAYQGWAFGNPWLPAQHHIPATELSVRGWNGLDWPSLDLVAANLFDPRFGLLPFGPLLAIGLVAPALAWRGRSLLPGAELTLALGLFAALLAFTRANQYARLQWNTGFRMLVPAVPLLFLATAAVLVRLPRALAVGLGAAAVAHAACLAMVREDPLQSIAAVATGGPTLPWLTTLWRTGDQYLPLLQRIGPQGLPLLVLAGLSIAILWWLPRGAATSRSGLDSRRVRDVDGRS